MTGLEKVYNILRVRVRVICGFLWVSADKKTRLDKIKVIRLAQFVQQTLSPIEL
jgi:hypothetical protein